MHRDVPPGHGGLRLAPAAVMLLSSCLLAAGCVLAAGCGGAESPGPATGTDEARPRRLRVASLEPRATRFAIALGASAWLVGVDPESARLPGLGDLPVVDAVSVADIAPDLVLLGAPPPDDLGERWLAAGIEPQVVAPHHLEEVYELSRELGARLVGPARALAFESGIGRPLGIVGGASPDRGRPRVVAIVGLEPLELAGGHSFETDLIEIGGGTSATHGGPEVRLEATPERWAALAPDLAIVMTRTAPTAAQRAALRSRVPPGVLLAGFPFDRDAFWLDDPAPVARRLQTLIARQRRELDALRGSTAPEPAS